MTLIKCTTRPMLPCYIIHHPYHPFIFRVPEKNPGPDRMLSQDEEDALVDYITYMARCGFPPRRSDVRMCIQELVVRAGRDHTTLFNMETGPSDKWFRGLLSRHPQLVEKVPQMRDRARSTMSNEFVIDSFFQTYSKCIRVVKTSFKCITILR